QDKYFWGNDEGRSREYAVTVEDELQFPCEVRTREPNSLGIYDLLGLVQEWSADFDEERDEENTIYRQTFGGSYETRVPILTEEEYEAMPEASRHPFLGLRLYADDSAQLHALHQQSVSASQGIPADFEDEGSLEGILISEPPTALYADESSAPESEAGTPDETELIAESHPPAILSDSVADVLRLWGVIQPGTNFDTLETESLIAFCFAPFNYVVADHGAGSEWLGRWGTIRRQILCEFPSAVQFRKLQKEQNELRWELIELTAKASVRNNSIPPWDGKLSSLSQYLTAAGHTGNHLLSDPYFPETKVLYLELEELLFNRIAMGQAFDDIMKNAGLISGAVLIGWLKEAGLQPSSSGVTQALEAGCIYPVNSISDCLTGLEELQQSLKQLSTPASTESLLTPALARQMWVTLPDRLIAALERAVDTIPDSDEVTQRFLSLSRSCLMLLRRLINGSADQSTSSTLPETQGQNSPLESSMIGPALMETLDLPPSVSSFFESLGGIIPAQLQPQSILCQGVADVEYYPVRLSEMLTDWENRLATQQQNLQGEFEKLSMQISQLKDIVCVQEKTARLSVLRDWWQELLEGGGKKTPALTFLDGLFPWAPEFIERYKNNLQAAWRLSQIAAQNNKAHEAMGQIMTELLCDSYTDLFSQQRSAFAGSPLPSAISHLLDVTHKYRSTQAPDLAELAAAWRTLEQTHHQ